MSGSFIFCLFSALLTVGLALCPGWRSGKPSNRCVCVTRQPGKGSSLICDTCKSKDATCTGTLQTCEHPDDVCLSVAAEFKIASRTISRSYKECSSSAFQTCKSTPFSMTFRPSISMRTSFYCCKNDSCNLAPIELPPVQDDLNGLECPSCFALGVNRCLNVDTLPCRGNEDHCYEISGTLIADKVNFNKTAAGCASAGVCSKKIGQTTFSKNVVDILTKFVCYPASKVAKIKTEL